MSRALEDRFLRDLSDTVVVEYQVLNCSMSLLCLHKVAMATMMPTV